MSVFNPTQYSGDIQSNLNKNFKISSDLKLWAIGGGKGGVGKSLVTANMGICLAQMGYSVTAIDLDLGGANLHTCLGVNIPEKTLSDFLTKKVSKITDLKTPTNIPNLSLISGAQDHIGMANLKHMHKTKILSHLKDLQSDFVLFDLGAGTSFNTLDFFIQADHGFLVVLPEPTSIENTYRFIKSVFYRRLKMIEEFLEIGPQLEAALNSKIQDLDSVSPAELIQKIGESNPVLGEKMINELKKFRPQLIINQVRTQADIDIGFSIKSICKRYFGIDLEFVGYLEYDPAVWQSVKKRRPLLLEYPNAKLANNFDKIIHRLLKID